MKDKKILFAVVVAALGYFVDIYDLILFSVVRVPSLKSMGLSDTAILDKGILLLNLQMCGMLLGGIFFGILGDRKGRLSVLFGSILLYSFANLFNAYAETVTTYGVLRFIAGFGLAGELGAGVTLVSELLPKEKRGYGTTIIASVGVSGALLAWTIAKHFDWRTAFIIGGSMGIVLLFLRVGVLESGLYKKAKIVNKNLGNFKTILADRKNLLKYLACIGVGLQLWYVVGILMTLSPEFASTLSMSRNVVAGESVFYCYTGLIFGDIASGLLSQYLKSRKKTMLLFLILSSLGIVSYFFLRNISTEVFYVFCIFTGFASGYWAMFVQIAAEQFGTNLRALVTTSVPNFVRGSLVPISILFAYLKDHIGILYSGLGIGLACILVSFVALFYLKESFHTDLDFLEP